MTVFKGSLEGYPQGGHPSRRDPKRTVFGPLLGVQKWSKCGYIPTNGHFGVFRGPGLRVLTVLVPSTRVLTLCGDGPSNPTTPGTPKPHFTVFRVFGGFWTPFGGPKHPKMGPFWVPGGPVGTTPYTPVLQGIWGGTRQGPP